MEDCSLEGGHAAFGGAGGDDGLYAVPGLAVLGLGWSGGTGARRVLTTALLLVGGKARSLRDVEADGELAAAAVDLVGAKAALARVAARLVKAGEDDRRRTAHHDIAASIAARQIRHQAAALVGHTASSSAVGNNQAGLFGTGDRAASQTGAGVAAIAGRKRTTDGIEHSAVPTDSARRPSA